jgi:hypothetical protein
VIAMSNQLALPLEPRIDSDAPLKRAWARARLRIPYDVAIRNPAMAICLRNIAAAEERRKRGTQEWLFLDLPPWKRYSRR